MSSKVFLPFTLFMSPSQTRTLSVSGVAFVLFSQIFGWIAAGMLLAPAAMAAACPAGPLVGYWPMEEGGVSVTTADLTGGNDGTLENGVLWTGAGGVMGSTDSLTFDGTDDQVRVANSSDFAFGTTEFTVSLFANTTTGDRSVLGNYDGDGWGLYFYSDGRVNFFGYGTGGSNDNAFLGGVLVGGWHHVTGVYKRSGADLTIETYVDGALIGSNTATVGDITSGSDLLFGRYLLQPHYAGLLDDVRIFGRALTGAEVAVLSTGCDDTDGDGQTDADEIACGSDPVDDASVSPDNESDGIPDCVDPDDDNDGVLDGPDNCDFDANPGQEDLDSDGIGDVCDPQTCSNGDIEGTETCDDGDLDNADGCSDVCAVEPGWACVHEPSTCVLAPLCDGQTATIFVDRAPGSPTVFGGPQNGLPYAGTLNGTGGNDVMVGTAGKDKMNASNGNDLLCALGDDDKLAGSNGNDTMFGEDGNDALDGSNGNDVLDGGAGNDKLNGSNGDDTLFGRDGNDTMAGSNGVDVLCGADDNDKLGGDSGNDRMDGGAGTDSMKGGFGSDICVNGEGFLSTCENTVTPVPECA